MYENLGLRNEFSSTLRNYTIIVFQNGDLNKVRDLFLKYGMVETVIRNDKEVINENDSVATMLSYLDENICKLQGIDPEIIQTIQQQKKQRAKIIQQGDKKYCGLDKKTIFKQCILPAI
jgi:putative cell wall-binding protein